MKITTKRLKMLPVTENDWPLFVRLYSDPGVTALCFDQPSDAELKAKFEARLHPWKPNSDFWLCLVIFDNISGEAVGITGFCMQDGIAEVGYLLLPEFHGKQYGTESLAALLNWAVTNHGITHYRAVVTAGNVASERVLIKCGFHLDQIVPDAYEIGGTRYADHIYICTRNEDNS
ncbi:GNAT family N-acetyltransferase [Vibrio mangrovi]|uniref:Acetyltransferase (GNAT) family protein n=1 Tax=Vibrio mangrovi TaxID=474394 RepID=A0A1Y6IR14_9VIBR|nr:GNAT family N-acetyltransferase [Vibrio mangrovi]MDW6003965.1 GNAT family N-acetyltransferase [Vibrio mangrovi]SMR99240.1 Acetyltransferase (GNAT) family protein [Vibrio mangrovi]